jgi:phage terminase large subunit-like protein
MRRIADRAGRGKHDEVGKVMVEGESGILACARLHEKLVWRPSTGKLRLPGDGLAIVYSGANPERLRGPQHHFAWADELAKWARPAETWDNLQLGLRLGDGARALVTTTPGGRRCSTGWSRTGPRPGPEGGRSTIPICPPHSSKR